MIHNDILVLDIETDDINPDKANLRYFGAYSYKENKYYLLSNASINDIKELLNEYKIFCGFNIKKFDLPILARCLSLDFKYKIIIDLYEISASNYEMSKSRTNKNRLSQMGVVVKDYKLKTIAQELKFDVGLKGDIDYKIFEKEEWSAPEIKDIEKYLKQDIDITRALFEWYEFQFAPLKEMLPVEEQRKYNHLKSSIASLGYKIICNKAGLDVEWQDKRNIKKVSFAGGHHIEPRFSKAVGNIVSIDFASAYPHAMMMGNLFCPSAEGWDGADYFKLKGCYDNKNQGAVEKALSYIYDLRLQAKQSGDKIKDKSYKLVVNSLYGLTGNATFKTLYNPVTASDCTSIVRTWLKKLAKTLEENGFVVLYGFTDSCMVKIPEQSSKEELMFVVDKFIEDVKTHMPFPKETFKLDIEREMKFVWFVAKNCYLWVDNKNKVDYKSTLLDANTPESVMKLFKNYMSDKIIKELDVKFYDAELRKELLKILEENPGLACEEYRCSSQENYKVKTSLQYQIAERYGAGTHHLIPNLKGVGVGRAITTKKKIGVRYCTIEEFNKSKLKVLDIDISQSMKRLKPFISKSQTKLEPAQ